MHTYSSALALSAVAVPNHLDPTAEVPLLSEPQAQGDLLIVPITEPSDVVWQHIPASGVQLIHGEQTGNTHWLHHGYRALGVQWAKPATPDVVGYVKIPEGQSALLVHTEEHGANGLAPGNYAIRRKRRQVVKLDERTVEAWDDDLNAFVDD